MTNEIVYSTKTARWHLVDDQGRPVCAGRHTDPSGRAFTLTKPIDLVTVGTEHHAVPTRLMADFGDDAAFVHPSQLGIGWQWRQIA